MKHIDEARLESDLAYRFQYLAEFMDFGEAEIAAIHASAPLLAPLVPGLVNAVYEKLYGYDATWRHFVPRQTGYEGAVPQSIADVSLDHEMIRFRKEHLGRYLAALVTRPYDGKMVAYLDMVGKMHTPKAGSPELDVPLVQMNALMGFVADAMTSTILGLGLERDVETKTVRAFAKLLWLQNDLINRHYQALPSTTSSRSTEASNHRLEGLVKA
ncbi:MULTISPECIES: protoglobin family protein [unclassified Schlesneria]|uniref:protoglobin family protein n=2 Tax=Planctomycetaceae TaxID=126 RepID=UPI00359FE660